MLETGGLSKGYGKEMSLMNEDRLRRKMKGREAINAYEYNGRGWGKGNMKGIDG